MNPSSISHFVLLVISLLPNQILCRDQSLEGIDLITKTCEHTRFRTLCIAALTSDTESKSTNLHGLAEISLKIALSNASETHDYISELAGKTKDKYMQQCLEDCSENYRQAALQIEDSMKALSSKGYENVKTWVSGAMSNAESCQEGFHGKRGYKCPFSMMNKFFSQLCSISLSITNLFD
ncbi:pectinesterase inhibitor-like [Pistacia vera]|uniref:pectinesterase inhibitor-like n=1 Tax=Pistacia vera TaxID=55513 RepID=UPI001263096D|nr:pectinesterase inhibitor-like [Pistacia vera]XP_031252507.1 pectinesterase inhibitor-like [Pistacia vera]